MFIPHFIAYSVTGEINQLASSYDSDVTINQNFTFQTGDTDPAVFNGIIFRGYDVLDISPNATVTVNISTQGTYSMYKRVIFAGEDRKTYAINGGSIIFNVDRIEKIGSGIEGLILGEAMNYGGNANFDFNTNFTLIASPDVYIQRGVFTFDGKPDGYYKFTKNVFIDVLQMQPSNGWGAGRNGKGLRMIFSLEGNGRLHINYDERTGTTINPNNIIQLKGDLAAEATSSGEIRINLYNPQSFFQGKISNVLGSRTNIELSLNQGGKWILNANSQITTLNVSNEESIVKNQYGKIDQISAVDFIKIADDGFSSRLTSPAPFVPRTLNVSTINGTNGVFRLMANMQEDQVDKINVNNLNGLQYIQIYQNPSRILLNNATATPLVVATTNNVAPNADFSGVATTIGIYDYLPILRRQASGGGGTEWILGSINRNPSRISQTLFDVLSLPYQIFRLQGDNLYDRTQNLFYPPTLNGVWAKIYGGGIYPKQPYATKAEENLFWNIQGGYDEAKIFGENRFFYGGSLDYIKLYANDSGERGYQGNVNSVGFGAYGGYVQKKGLVLDGGSKYIYSFIHSNLYQTNKPIDFGNHILSAYAKMGYNFYLFTKSKQKIIEKCVQKIFCRNDKTTVQIRDDSAFIQPYFSIAPAIISGNNFSFTDRAGSRIKAHLHFNTALITKLGILGVKRFTFQNHSILELRASSEYSNDINTGGNVTLIDNINIPLEHTSLTDNRIGFGIGSHYKLLNESLEFHFNFKTEFLGHINTYWLLSAGFRYKFGQNAPRSYKSLNLRPQAPKHKNPKNFFKPYDNIPPARNNTFHQNNHFKEY